MRRWAGTLGMCVVAWICGTSPAQAAPLPVLFLECGATITSTTSFQLGNDLSCPGAGAALTINTKNITIDLGAHLVRGDGALGNTGTKGFLLGATASGVTIRNGTIAAFDRGIELSDSSGNTFEDLTVARSEIDSIFMIGSNNRIANNTFVTGGGVFLNDAATAATAADGNVIENNVFARDGVVAQGADGNTVRHNTFYGASTINFGVGTDGSQGNVIDGNTLLGPNSAGISVSGDTSDGNQIINNIVRGGTAAADGIFISDGDSELIANNTVTGNAASGIELAGSATAATIAGNTASGNVNEGIVVAATATGAAIMGNATSRNGNIGIRANSGAVPDVQGNTAEFNGFLNGIDDNANFGILAIGATGSGNSANGNDVATVTQQCNPSGLCPAPATPLAGPATITTCQATTPANLTLENPLVCPAADALQPSSDGITIDLTTMHVEGGGAAGNAAIDFTAFGARNAITVRGGALSGNAGIRSALVQPLTNSTFDGVLVAGAATSGIDLKQGSDHDTITGGAVVGSGGIGIVAESEKAVTITSVAAAANADNGIQVSKFGDQTPTFAKVLDNNVIGNAGSGIALSNTAHALVQGNKVIGSHNDGIEVSAFLQSTTLNTFRKNTVVGSGARGIALSSDGTSNAVGLTKNTITGNISQANDSVGITISDPDSVGNKVTANKVIANLTVGISTPANLIKTTVKGNAATDNGGDGISVGNKANLVQANVAVHNGFIATTVPPVDNDVGRGITALPGTKGCGNKVKNNDDPVQIVPNSLKKPC